MFTKLFQTYSKNDEFLPFEYCKLLKGRQYRWLDTKGCKNGEFVCINKVWVSRNDIQYWYSRILNRRFLTVILTYVPILSMLWDSFQIKNLPFWKRI